MKVCTFCPSDHLNDILEVLSDIIVSSAFVFIIVCANYAALLFFPKQTTGFKTVCLNHESSGV